MEISVKVKKYGKANWQNKSIILPDFCKPYFDIYNLEIIEMHNISCMCLFFQTKIQPDVDAVVHTIYRPEIQSNISEGFKIAFELLEKHLHPEEDMKIPEQIYGV